MMFERQRSIIIATLLLFGLCLLGIGAWFYGAHIVKFFSLEMLKCYARDLYAFTHSYYYTSIVLYILVGITAVSLFLPIVTVYMLAAGFLFGPWEGACYAITGVTIGALCAFLLVRSTVGVWVHKYEQRLVTINKFIEAYGFYALMLLRMSHLVPFFLLNIAAGLMPISFATFVGSTMLGVIPGALLFSWTGQYLCSINSVWDLVTAKTLLVGLCVIIVIICFALVGATIMRRRVHT